MRKSPVSRKEIVLLVLMIIVIVVILYPDDKTNKTTSITTLPNLPTDNVALIGADVDQWTTKYGQPTVIKKFTSRDVVGEDRIEIFNYTTDGTVRDDESITEDIWKTKQFRLETWFRIQEGKLVSFWSRYFHINSIS